MCHLLEDELQQADDAPCGPGTPGPRADGAFRRLEGLNAISVLDPEAQCIAAAKNGSPLVLGWGDDGNLLAATRRRCSSTRVG